METQERIYNYYKREFESGRRPTLKEISDHLAHSEEIPFQERKRISRERVNQLLFKLKKKGRFMDLSDYFYKHQSILVPVELFQPNFIEKHGRK